MGSRSIIRLKSAILTALLAIALAGCQPSNKLDVPGSWLILGTALDGRTMDGITAVHADGSPITRLVTDQLIVGPNDFGAALSPDGRHLAYITAADTNFSDLTLNLLTLPEGTTEEITPLLSAASAPDQDARSLADPSYAAANAIAGQDRSLAWSPDSTQLAFIGAQDSASADLYLYSVEDREMTRLSEEPEHGMRPAWSPDGRSILFQSYESFEIAGGFDMGPVWMVDLAGDGVQELYNPGPVEDELIVGWVSDSRFLVFSRDIDCGWHNLRFFGTGSERSTVVWAGYFNKMSFHPDTQAFLLSIDSFTAACNDDGVTGLILRTAASTEWMTVADFAPVELAFSPTGFYAVTLEPAVFEVDMTGALRRLPDPIAFIPVGSPDGVYWAWAGQHPKFEAGLWVGEADTVPDLIFEGAVQVVTWIPDGSGLFFVGDNDLYRWQPGAGVPELVERDIVLRDFRGAVWATFR